MLRQRLHDALSIDSRWNEVRRAKAKRLRLPQIAARDDDVVIVRRKPSGDGAAEAAIAAENQDPAHKTRDACSRLGSQQLSRRPNSRYRWRAIKR